MPPWQQVRSADKPPRRPIQNSLPRCVLLRARAALFAGIAMDGTALTIDRKRYEAFYQKPGVSADDLIATTAPRAAGSRAPAPWIRWDRRWMARLAHPRRLTVPRLLLRHRTILRRQLSELKTYPMEDPAPGEEPKTN